MTETAREAGTEKKTWRRHLHLKEPDYSRPLLEIPQDPEMIEDEKGPMRCCG